MWWQCVGLDQRIYLTSGSVSTGMGDRSVVLFRYLFNFSVANKQTATMHRDQLRYG